MCTSIVEIVRASGAGVSESGWFPVTTAVVSYDHPHHALLEDAITIDFMNPPLGPGARAAVEITLESAKGLLAALERVIAEAEEGGRAGAQSVTKDEGGGMKDDPRSAGIPAHQSSVVRHHALERT